MDECEVCLRPTVDYGYVTFDTPDGNPCRVQFCRDCITAVCTLMTERYNGAVDRGNAEVDAVKRMLGIGDENDQSEPE